MGLNLDNFWIDIFLNIVIIIGLVFIIRTFVISPFQVYGPSMCDTMNFVDGRCQRAFGEYIIVNKFGYQNFLGWKVGEPKRGDIIVFKPPKHLDEYFIKRVIGLPGETIKLQNGEVFIVNKENPQGFKLEENYLNHTNKGNTAATGGVSLFEVPQGEYFVLGDNRTQSSDSRSCFSESLSALCGQNGNIPFVPAQNIEGKAWLVLWPLPNIKMLPPYQYGI